MSDDPKRFEPVPTDPERVRDQRAADAHRARIVEDSLERLGDRCPECGALGSLEPFGPEGEEQIRCIDCDEVVARATKLGGFGRR